MHDTWSDLDRTLLLLASLALADDRVADLEREALAWVADAAVGVGEGDGGGDAESRVAWALELVRHEAEPISFATRVASVMRPEQKRIVVRLCIALVQHDGTVTQTELQHLADIATGLAMTQAEFTEIVEQVTA